MMRCTVLEELIARLTTLDEEADLGDARNQVRVHFRAIEEVAEAGEQGVVDLDSRRAVLVVDW